MTAISHLSYVQAALDYHRFPQGAALTERMAQIALTYFGMAQNGYLIGYGLKQMLIRAHAHHPHVHRSAQKTDACTKLLLALFGPLSDVTPHIPNYLIMQGSFLIPSGFFGTMSWLHYQQMIDLKGMLPLFNTAADALFISASLASLKHNLELFRGAQNLPPQPTEAMKVLSHQVMVSSCLGALSALGYILASVLPILGLDASLALIFGCIAVFLGGLNILYDFLVIEKKLLAV